MNNRNLWYVVFLVNRGDVRYEWTEKFASCVLKASSEDEAYKTALLALPKAIGFHKECGNDEPHLDDGDEKDCAVDVAPLDEFIASQQTRWEDIRTWEESPPF